MTQKNSLIGPINGWQLQAKKSLPSEMLLLKVSQEAIGDCRKRKGELKSDITTVFSATELSDRTSEPNLSHAQNCSHNTECESCNGCESRRKFVPVEVVLWMISGEATLEEYVLRQGDAFVNCEPIGNQ